MLSAPSTDTLKDPTIPEQYSVVPVPSGEPVPDEIEARLRTSCLALPDVHEHAAWKGTRWMVRTRTFVHVLGIETDDTDPMVVLAFRSSGDELETLRRAGSPFFVLGWGRDAMGMVLDDPDWDEVAGIIGEAFRHVAPKTVLKLLDD